MIAIAYETPVLRGATPFWVNIVWADLGGDDLRGARLREADTDHEGYGGDRL